MGRTFLNWISRARAVGAMRYALAVFAIAAATGLKLSAGRWLSDADTLFLAAVSITAWLGGPRPGLLAVALAAAAQGYYFLAPYHSFDIASAQESVQLAIWSTEAALLCGVVGFLRSARTRLRSAHDALEIEVGNRTRELADSNAGLRREVAERDRVQRELDRSEGQLHQAQKMDAVGRLAGGIAHDFNNLLSVILSYGELILLDMKPDEPAREDVFEIVKAGRRAAELTRQLLQFSRQQIVEPKILRLAEVLGGMDKMLRRLVGEDVDVTCLGGASQGRVMADRGSIEQVFMNLVVNARDAMPAGGKLTIETSEVVLDGEFARAHIGVEPGPYVMLAVSDTGTGMDKETQDRIFEPFFTTKEQGKGTGLGLATVFGIVRQSGGTIWVYSEPGKGSTFKVYLPAVATPVQAVRVSASLTTMFGNETILVVEDEDQVRDVACGILKRLGYTVLVAAAPSEASAICANHPAPIHLLLSDVVMPEMSGPELARRLKQVRPDMKVLCMSGYTDDAVVRHGVLGSDVPYLQKPLTPLLVGRRVREVLASPPAIAAGDAAAE